MEETSINEIKPIKQFSELISIELPGMNQVALFVEDLEYLNIINIQHFLKLLSNVTAQG